MVTDTRKDIDAFRKDSSFPMPIVCAVLTILENVYEKGVARLEGFPTARTEVVAERICEGALAGGKVGTGPRQTTFNSWLKKKSIVIIGKGATGGRPIIKTFRKMGIEPNVIDSKTKNPEDIKKNADIIISAVGKLDVVKKEEIKKGVILLSIGLHKEKDGKLHGDYEEEEIKDIAGFYTPTPGGVGPVNVACLLENLIKASAKTSY